MDIKADGNLLEYCKHSVTCVKHIFNRKKAPQESTSLSAFAVFHTAILSSILSIRRNRIRIYPFHHSIPIVSIHRLLDFIYRRQTILAVRIAIQSQC